MQKEFSAVDREFFCSHLPLVGCNAIHEEFDVNIKLAWKWLTDERRWKDLIEKLALGLYHYATIFRRIGDLRLWLINTRNNLPTETRSRDPLTFTILSTLELFCEDAIGIRDHSWLDRLTKVWWLVTDHGLAQPMGFWYVLLVGMMHGRNLDPDVEVRLEDAVAHVRNHNDPWMLGMSLLIQSNWWREFYLKEDLLLEASRIFESLGVLYEQGLVAEIQENHAVQKKRPPAEIMYHFQRKKQFFMKMGYLYHLKMDFYSLASYYFQIGEFEQGFSTFHEEQDFYEQFGILQKVADSLSWESMFAYRYSTIDHALKTRQRIIEIARILDRPLNAAWGLFEFGEIYRVFGDQEKALNLYEQANMDFEKMNLTLGLGYYQRAYGDIALQNTQYSAALKYYQEYMRYAFQDNHLWSIAQARAKLALAHAFLGELEQSRQESKTAFTEIRTWGKDDLTLQTLLAEPVCLIKEGRLEEAIELSTFILNHPVSWNETKNQARGVLDVASHELPREVVETAKERGRKALLEDVLSRYLDLTSASIP